MCVEFLRWKYYDVTYHILFLIDYNGVEWLNNSITSFFWDATEIFLKIFWMRQPLLVHVSKGERIKKKILNPQKETMMAP